MSPECPACKERVPATHFVSCDSHAWGGSPAYGSFRSFFCKDHADEWMERFENVGHKARLEELGGRGV